MPVLDASASPPPAKPVPENNASELLSQAS